MTGWGEAPGREGFLPEEEAWRAELPGADQLGHVTVCRCSHHPGSDTTSAPGLGGRTGGQLSQRPPWGLWWPGLGAAPGCCQD